MPINRNDQWSICFRDEANFKALRISIRIMDITGLFEFVNSDNLPERYRNITSWKILLFKNDACYFDHEASTKIFSQLIVLKKMPRVFQKIFAGDSAL